MNQQYIIKHFSGKKPDIENLKTYINIKHDTDIHELIKKRKREENNTKENRDFEL